jgi:hypothetical protein
MPFLFTPSLVRAVDGSGDPINGAKMYFYQTGTTVNALYYLDGLGETPGPHPLVSDADGIFEPAFLSAPQTYRVKLTNATGSATLFDADPVSVVSPSEYTASLFFATYAELIVIEPDDVGTSAAVFDDAGTHTDPVSMDTVPNNGLYSWTGTDWQWLATLGQVLPGGTDGQIQYNDNGLLAGLTGLTETAGTLSAATINGGTVTVSTPFFNLAQTWNDAGIAFGAMDFSITNTNSDYSSYFVRGRVGGADRFRITRDDTLVFGAETGEGAETAIGIRRIGGSSIIGICSGRSFDTGKLANIINCYWEAGVGANGIANVDTATVRADIVTNRLSIESAANMTHIADTGRFEWEGAIANTNRIRQVFYQKATAEGRTCDFNNVGQAPARASPVVSMTVENDADDPFHICKWNGSGWTMRAKFDGLGRLFQSDQTAPSTPTGGGIQYVEGGAGKFKTSAGNVVIFAPSSVPNVTGSRGGNAALASLLTQLASLGLITDGTS